MEQQELINKITNIIMQELKSHDDMMNPSPPNQLYKRTGEDGSITLTYLGDKDDNEITEDEAKLIILKWVAYRIQENKNLILYTCGDNAEICLEETEPEEDEMDCFTAQEIHPKFFIGFD